MCNTEILSFNWDNPSLADIAIIKRFIEIRCEMIDEAKAAKK